MLILRSVQLNDLKSLYDLSNIMTFINLPPDEELILSKIESSIKSFKTPSKKLADNYYIFVLENLANNSILGVSMIHGQHGTEEEPHFYLTVGHEKKFSHTINTGFIHGTLKLGLETNGYSEIGGLILHPDHRKGTQKLGKQLSFVRFLYMSMYPERFKAIIHSELMPPLDKHGNSPLWEAIGRRFLNMNYTEADILSRSNKEFILSLFPSENIYQTLLPMEARESIGKVGKETEPVKKMLESIGFQYTFEVDPFDGGPHYRCPLEKIKPIREKISGNLCTKKNDPHLNELDALVNLHHPDYDFFAIKTKIYIYPNGDFGIDETVLKSLPISLPQTTTAIPFH
jgi:arginine N-succinyltransferase